MAKPKSAVGLYVGTKAVDIVELKETAGKIEVSSYARVPVKEAEDPIFSAIVQAQQASKIASPEVIACLPSRDTTIRYFRMPLIPPRQREGAIRIEARRYIPYKVEDLASSFIVTGEGKKPPHMDVLFVGARREQVDALTGVLNKAGKKPVAIDALPFALIRFLIQNGQLDAKLDTAIVNINGDDTASIYVTKNGIPYLARDVALEAASGDVAKKLCDETEISVDYYKRQFKAEKVYKVIISGETLLANIIEPLGERLGVPVEAADLARIKGASEVAPGACVAIGLALRGAQKPAKEEINLLPSAFVPEKEAFAPLVIFQSVIAIAVLVSMFILSQMSLGLIAKDITYEESRAPGVSGELLDMMTPQLMEVKADYEARYAMLKALVAERSYLTLKLNQLAKFLPDGAWLTGVEYSESLASGIGMVYTDKINRAMAIRGNISGETRREEIEAADALLNQLRGDADFFAGFSEIHLKSTKVERIGKSEVTAFEFNAD